jgi:hypothetical protein
VIGTYLAISLGLGFTGYMLGRETWQWPERRRQRGALLVIGLVLLTYVNCTGSVVMNVLREHARFTSQAQSAPRP